jgi:hypothetical protein
MNNIALIKQKGDEIGDLSIKAGNRCEELVSMSAKLNRHLRSFKSVNMKFNNDENLQDDRSRYACTVKNYIIIINNMIEELCKNVNTAIRFAQKYKRIVTRAAEDIIMIDLQYSVYNALRGRHGVNNVETIAAYRKITDTRAEYSNKFAAITTKRIELNNKIQRIIVDYENLNSINVESKAAKENYSERNNLIIGDNFNVRAQYINELLDDIDEIHDEFNAKSTEYMELIAKIYQLSNEYNIIVSRVFV